MRDAGGISESDVSTDRRADDAPPQPATIRSCKRWSKQEMSQLKALYDQTLSDDEIAKRLNRSRRAVRTMILRLGGEHIREATRAWTDSECELVLSMHANGASCATIAIAMPERTELAIFRKLSHMVGAAPFAAARKRRLTQAPAPEPPPAVAEPPAAKAEAPSIAETPAAKAEGPVPEPSGIRVAANEPGLPPWQCRPASGVARTLATVDAMVRWLRSRDFVVLKKKSGWRVDQHDLKTDLALVDFVNIRRERLRLPVFILAASEPEPDNLLDTRNIVFDLALDIAG